MTSSQRSKISLPRLASLACSSALIQSNSVQGIAIDDLLSTNMMAQVDADLLEIGSQAELIDGIITNMAQDGVIRIPIKKQETGFLSQVYAEADSAADAEQISQTFDLSDPV